MKDRIMPKALHTLSPDFAFSAGGSIELPSGDASLTVESALDRVKFMSDFDITRDARGLDLAEAVAAILVRTIDVLKADQAVGKLPDVLTLIAPTQRDNPF